MDMIPKSMAREFNDALTDGLRKAVEDGDVSEQRALECREWLQRGEFLGDYLDALTDATGQLVEDIVNDVIQTETCMRLRNEGARVMIGGAK